MLSTIEQDRLDRLARAERQRLDAACLRSEWSLDEMVEREHQAGIELGPYHRQKLLKSAPPRILDLLEQGALKPRLVGMPEQTFTAAGFTPPFSHTAIATTVTETYLYIPGQFASVAVGDPAVGKTYFVKFGGVYSTVATAPTVVNTLRWHGATSTTVGGVSLGASVAGTTVVVTNAPFFGEALVTFRSLGLAATSATVTGCGNTVLGGTAGTAPALSLVYGTNSTATVDTYTQANMGIGVSWTWGTSSASNTVTCQYVVFGSYS